MRSAAKFCLVLAGFLLVVAFMFQALSLCSVLLLTEHPAEVFTEKSWLVPMWITSLVVLPVGYILCISLREKGTWLLLPLVLAGVGTVLSLIVALALKAGLPPRMNELGQEVGLTAWRLCYRHLSSVFAGGLTVLAAVLHLLACRQDRTRRDNEGYTPVYDLSGEPLFRNMDSTLGLDTYASQQEGAAPRKMKRSRKAALRKWQESQEEHR